MQKTKRNTISLIIGILIISTLTGLSTRQTANASVMDAWSYGGAGNDFTYGLVATADGGHMMAGSTCTYGAGCNDVWLVKVDAHGNMAWNKTYGGIYNDYGCNLVETSDGGYALVGYTCYDEATGEDEYPDAWLIKVDADGNEQWNQTYGGVDGEYTIVLATTSDGGYAIAGSSFTSSFGAGDSDFWLLKIDSNGTMQWNQTYGGPQEDVGYVLATTPDGGYAIVGSTVSFGAGDRDFWLIKTDSNGVIQWNQTYGGVGFDEGQCLTVTDNGVYAVSGVTTSFGAGGSDGWLIVTQAPDAAIPTASPPTRNTTLQASMPTIIVVVVALILVAVIAFVVFKRKTFKRKTFKRKTFKRKTTSKPYFSIA